MSNRQSRGGPQQVVIPWTAEEWRVLLLASKRSGLTVEEWVRQVALAAAEGPGRAETSLVAAEEQAIRIYGRADAALSPAQRAVIHSNERVAAALREQTQAMILANPRSPLAAMAFWADGQRGVQETVDDTESNGLPWSTDPDDPSVRYRLDDPTQTRRRLK